MRASFEYKQVEFLSTRIGETFKGLVNVAVSRGLFVELDENKCEGFVTQRIVPFGINGRLTRTAFCLRILDA